VVGAGLVVGERHAQELVAEQVAAAAVLAGQPGADERGERAMHGRLRAGDDPGHLVEAHALRELRQLHQHGEHPIGADQPIVADRFRGRRLFRRGGRRCNVHRVPHVRQMFQETEEGASVG